MKVIETKLSEREFVIMRGKEYFSFFVDHDRACWSKATWNARGYQFRVDAERDLQELLRRQNFVRNAARTRSQSAGGGGPRPTAP